MKCTESETLGVHTSVARLGQNNVQCEVQQKVGTAWLIQLTQQQVALEQFHILYFGCSTLHILIMQQAPKDK